jgi:hypothetical protein
VLLAVSHICISLDKKNALFFDWAVWLIPVIPAWEEEEIWKITVQGKPRQKVRKTPS